MLQDTPNITYRNTKRQGKDNMTKEDLPFDYRNIPETKPRKIESKKVQNPYAEKYMENKKRIVIQESVRSALVNIKDKRRFNSDNETVKFLLDLERELTKMNMIKEFSKCPDCGTKMSAEHIKKVHNHVDSNVECFGCMQKSYKVMLNEEDHQKIAKALTEQKKKQTEQNEQKDEKIEDDYIDENGLNAKERETAKWLEEDNEKRSIKIEQPV